MALIHLQPHAEELLLQLLGGAGAGIGKEQKLLILPVQPVHKPADAGQQAVSVVDDAVHIADKSFSAS